MFDLTDREATKLFLEEKQFDVVIHAAASGGSRLKPDTSDILYENLLAFQNLYCCRDHFKKLITFGSGAEINNPSSPYGLSKSMIANITKNTPGFYNLRIFAVFDKDELSTRFIKSCITNYIKGEEITIHRNKLMDFFGMSDLHELVWYYISEPWQNLKFTVNCTYEDKTSLLDIANFINTLDTHKCQIKVKDTTEGNNYISSVYDMPNLKYKGLYQCITEMYNQLLTLLGDELSISS
jgi:GDP-L-fucose synthase